jgi:hypothetical protein
MEAESSLQNDVVNENNKFWEELISYFPWYDAGHIENESSNNSIVACVFITVVTFLPSHCLEKIGGFIPSHYLAMIKGFLPSRCLATIGGFLPSCYLAMIGGFLPSHCIATIRGLLSSRCLAAIWGIHRYTHTQTATWSHKLTFIFFKIRKVH